MVGCIKKYWKRIIKLQKHCVVFLLIFSLLLSQFSFLIPQVHAASSPWIQTDWTGETGTNVDTTTAGQVTLTNTEKLSNTGFENDLSSWSEVPSYTLNDQFTTDLAAGSVNGTSAEPTGGTRTVVDTNSKISISSGVLNFASGGGATDGIWYSSLSRSSGRVLITKIVLPDTTGWFRVGWDTDTSGAINDRLAFNSGIIYMSPNSGSSIVLGAYTAGIYYVAGVMRGSGFYWYIKGGTFTNWTLLYITALGTASGIPAFGVDNTTVSTFTSDNIRIPTATWLPTPLAYDTFTRGDGAIGNSETTGPDSQTTPSLAWTGGAISTNKNVITPSLGSEAVTNGGFDSDTSGWSSLNSTIASVAGGDSGNALEITPTGGSSQTLRQYVSTTVGQWYSLSYAIKSGTSGNEDAHIYYARADSPYTTSYSLHKTSSASWVTYPQAFRNLDITGRLNIVKNTSTAGTMLFDTVSIKPLTLSSLFSTVSTSDADVIADANVTLTAGTQAGLVLNLDDTTTPANFIIVYHDGTYVKVDEAVAGVYTNKQSTAVTYSAGATLRAIREGTKLRVYYNNALVGAELTMTANTNTIHGLFSTYSGNSFDNFTLWPRGSGTTKFTDAPFEELTATRDTGTKYAGTASAKLVTGGVDATFLQSVNVGDTSTYTLIGYAYTDGSAVTTADLNLYYNGAVISTSFTDMGGGWYRLTGTLTGANEARDYGVKVKAGKTVYVDNMSVNRYETSGTLTSSIFDSGQGSNWGTLTYSATTPTNTSVTVKARSSNDSGMGGATAFSSCNAITSGVDISSNNCITDTDRYIQYQLTLATTDTTITPTFSDISTTFEVSDADAPGISLTALTPDPNTDTTPTISGTATESIGTVSTVQFQMDSTTGSWTACTADDGSFDEASEAFTCTSSVLADGSHTMYVRATDSNGNTTGSGSESSDTFTIDATTPVAVELDSPGDNSYNNNERPTFKWKATTDATAGLSKYVLEIDNPSLGSGQPSGDFSVDNIPTSGTEDVINNRYVIHFENFSDSDATNNYISVYTRSSSDWSTDSNSGQNDGKLRGGIAHWTVKAVDNVGNETSSSRTLFVDRTNPRVELTQINETPFTTHEYTTTDKTPAIYGKITDPLAGGDSSQTQDENEPRVASGPKQVEIKVEKKEGLLYKLHTTYTINMDRSWYTCDNTEVTDNTKQKCDKYLPFEYIQKENLDLGTYRITVTGKDKADNTAEIRLTLNITTLSEIVTPEEEQVIDEEILKQVQDDGLTPEEAKQVKEELDITKPIEPSFLEKASEKISQTSQNIFTSIGSFISSVFNGVGRGIRYAFNATGKAIAFVGRGIGNSANTVGQGLAFVMEKIGDGISGVAQSAGNMLASIGQGIGNIGKAIGNGYNRLANNAPGLAKTILTGIGNRLSTTSNFIANVANTVATTTSRIAQNTGKAIASAAHYVVIGTTTFTKNVGLAIASATQNWINNTKNGIANLAFSIGERTEDISHGVGTTIIKIGYLFVSEPTTIANVKVAKSTATTMTVTWETNHPANGKVNYGLTADYGQDVQSEKRITNHEFTVSGLEPNTTYYYEVMSHNRNYVYDANHTFTTPAE